MPRFFYAIEVNDFYNDIVFRIRSKNIYQIPNRVLYDEGYLKRILVDKCNIEAECYRDAIYVTDYKAEMKNDIIKIIEQHLMSKGLSNSARLAKFLNVKDSRNSDE